jgi:hypothetical protein
MLRLELPSEILRDGVRQKTKQRLSALGAAPQRNWAKSALPGCTTQLQAETGGDEESNRRHVRMRRMSPFN